MRLLAIWIISAVLLFGYQKGEQLSPKLVKQLNLKEGKVYVIDFFASWCISCKREIPDLNRLNTQLDHDKYEIIGIDVDEDSQKAAAFQKEMRQKGMLSYKVIDDPEGKIIKRFNPVGMPALYIVKENRVQDLILGAKDAIDKLLLKKIGALE